MSVTLVPEVSTALPGNLGNLDSRDDKGRFTEGHQLSVGNKGGRPRKPWLPAGIVLPKQSDYIECVGAVVTLEQFKRITERAVEQAIKGDHRAREWISAYTIGPPGHAGSVAMPVFVQVLGDLYANRLNGEGDDVIEGEVETAQAEDTAEPGDTEP